MPETSFIVVGVEEEVDTLELSNVFLVKQKKTNFKKRFHQIALKKPTVFQVWVEFQLVFFERILIFFFLVLQFISYFSFGAETGEGAINSPNQLAILI